MVVHQQTRLTRPSSTEHNLVLLGSEALDVIRQVHVNRVVVGADAKTVLDEAGQLVESRIVQRHGCLRLPSMSEANQPLAFGGHGALDELEVVEGDAGAHRDAFEGVVGDVAGDADLLGDEAV